jgi:hypothetical protein
MSSVRPLEEPGAGNGLTIEQLAAATGMSVRNIRAHQARGLLDAPEVRMRVGYYSVLARAERLGALRPIASDALIAIFQQRLGTAVEAAFMEITRRLAERADGP